MIKPCATILASHAAYVLCVVCNLQSITLLQDRAQPDDGLAESAIQQPQVRHTGRHDAGHLQWTDPALSALVTHHIHTHWLQRRQPSLSDVTQRCR